MDSLTLDSFRGWAYTIVVTPRCGLHSLFVLALTSFLLFSRPTASAQPISASDEERHATARQPFGEGQGGGGVITPPPKGPGKPGAESLQGEGWGTVVPGAAVQALEEEGPFPYWGRIDPAVKKILIAMGELLSTPEGKRELGHILEEAKALLAQQPGNIRFSPLEKAYGTYDSQKDEIRLKMDLEHVNPALVVDTLVHELQHRYDNRIQERLFKDELYVLELEKRAFKAGSLAFGLALDRLKPEDLRQSDLAYFRVQSQRRMAYLLGEDSPYFHELVEIYYRREAAEGGDSQGREPAAVSIVVTEEQLKKVEAKIAELEKDTALSKGSLPAPDSHWAGRLKALEESLRTQRLEAEVLRRRLRIARFEQSRGMRLTVDESAAAPTKPPPAPRGKP